MIYLIFLDFRFFTYICYSDSIMQGHFYNLLCFSLQGDQGTKVSAFPQNTYTVYFTMLGAQ